MNVVECGALQLADGLESLNGVFFNSLYVPRKAGSGKP
jgi:hypothetical protein